MAATFHDEISIFSTGVAMDDGNFHPRLARPGPITLTET
jgi:hypothetical protein